MSVSEDLINFDVIEEQKENIQSLPGGRSARALAQIFSSGKNGDKLASPSPNETKTLNDAIKQEYEAEIQASADSDDPLDVYDRYVKWTLNAYPSAQATPESGLLPLLERATKAFLTSQHYKNDPRYLRLWLHYIRLFSDAPRETFAFLARHHVGEGLALFYEEYAAWLEGAGRWTQAEEVYKLGIEREARPVERLLRKFGEFQKRFEQRGSDGPSSPALPTVRPALAAKVDPFSSARNPAADPQAQRPRAGIGGGSTTRSGKPKLAVFSDADAPAGGQPAVSAQSKGWESIGLLRDRRKENTMEAKPWVGETLKTEKKAGPVQKMTIYRDESASNAQDQSQVQHKIPDHHVREAVNPRTGRRERVFVNLELVYPDYKNPSYEISFEELRATSRGWMQKDWSSQKKALKEISGNATSRNPPLQDDRKQRTDKALAGEVNRKLTLQEKSSHQTETVYLQEEPRDGKARKIKVREISETQTIKTNLDSPTGPKIRRKNTSEPTMTFHTRAATDEIYSIFNQPLKVETAHADHGDSLFESEYEDDDYTSAGESTGTGRVSAGTSEFGDDETSTLRKTHEDDEDDEDAESVDAGEWTEFSTSKHVPKISSDRERHPDSTHCDNMDATEADDVSNGQFEDETGVSHYANSSQEQRRQRFILEPPEDYNPPVGLYRDAAGMAQNRLPFMTPIIEKTESSLPSMTAARNHVYNAKTPCKPVLEANYTPPGLPTGDLLGSTPVADITTTKDHDLSVIEDMSPIPVAKKLRRSPEKNSSSKNIFEKAFIIKETQCDPTDRDIRKKILKSIDPPLASYVGYHDHSDVRGNHAADIQKFVKALKKPSRSGDKGSFTPPVLRFSGADRSYAIRRELGAGAYAPVYLAESVDNVDTDSASDPESDSVNANNKRSFSSDRSSRWQRTMNRHDLEAIKVETDPPSAWEFYMIRIAHERLRNSPYYSRVAESIVNAHELHLFKNESFLVEDYRGQGTLLDLVNIVRTEAITSTGNAEAGMDEILAMFFSVELFRTVEGLHACGILHGDIKPDNCLVRFDDKSKTSLPTPPSESLIDLEDDDAIADPSEVHYSPRGLCNWRQRGLTLIDFGRGIDMRAFQPGVQFIAEWEIGQHECNEVREMRPWTYQIDLYGVAVTIHTMLFGKYLESVPVCGDSRSPNGRSLPNGSSSSMGSGRRYRIRETLKRYWDREIWNDVFDLLLNPYTDRWMQMEREGSSSNLTDNNNTNTMPPVLHSMRYVREKMEAWLVANAEKKGLSLQIRKLEAHLSRRKEKLDREK
ncbi:hypothetical protein VTN77DRAFT_3661 [Rasamsonia byssochlamydoides]|uniref:uncharacterized protein n=1 Tax=Rasamsonia byssochlamydoides TaxID=89139 RepID=UPI003742ED23